MPATHSEARSPSLLLRSVGADPLSRVRVARAVDTFDATVFRLVHPVALPALRILLGLIFVWFGGLKVTGSSPVAAMVAGTLPFANPDLVVPVLGGVEVLLGLALVTGLGLRIALPALVAHLAGTFLTFVMLPGQMFRDSDPLLLTQSGEFVAKNLVLVCAGLVLIAHGRTGSRQQPGQVAQA
jgi:putative oxidoreductase